MISIAAIVEHKGKYYGFTKTAYLRLLNLRLTYGPTSLKHPAGHQGRLLKYPIAEEEIAVTWTQLKERNPFFAEVELESI